MGTFMASASFRWPQQLNWPDLKPKIRAMYQGVEALVDDLDKDQSAYTIISPYGDMGVYLQEIPRQVSAMTGDYAIFCMCVDSDFALLELYQNGSLLEKSVIGALDIAGEMDEMAELTTPKLELWKPLLQKQEDEQQLQVAFTEETVFVEDQLRRITELTGIPIFDDEMVYESF